MGRHSRFTVWTVFFMLGSFGMQYLLGGPLFSMELIALLALAMTWCGDGECGD